MDVDLKNTSMAEEEDKEKTTEIWLSEFLKTDKDEREEALRTARAGVALLGRFSCILLTSTIAWRKDKEIAEIFRRFRECLEERIEPDRHSLVVLDGIFSVVEAGERALREQREANWRMEPNAEAVGDMSSAEDGGDGGDDGEDSEDDNEDSEDDGEDSEYGDEDSEYDDEETEDDDEDSEDDGEDREDDDEETEDGDEETEDGDEVSEDDGEDSEDDDEETEDGDEETEDGDEVSEDDGEDSEDNDEETEDDDEVVQLKMKMRGKGEAVGTEVFPREEMLKVWSVHDRLSDQIIFMADLVRLVMTQTVEAVTVHGYLEQSECRLMTVDRELSSRLNHFALLFGGDGSERTVSEEAMSDRTVEIWSQFQLYHQPFATLSD